MPTFRVVNPDSWGCSQGDRVGARGDEQVGAAQVASVVGTRNGHGLTQLAGAVSKSFAAAPQVSHLLLAADGVYSADEDALARSLRTRDSVEVPPHAVDQVDVGVAGRAEHDLVAFGAPAGGVCRIVCFPQVAFGFGNATDEDAPA